MPPCGEDGKQYLPDERILESGTFVTSLLKKTERAFNETLHWKASMPDLSTLAERIAKIEKTVAPMPLPRSVVGTDGLGVYCEFIKLILTSIKMAH